MGTANGVLIGRVFQELIIKLKEDTDKIIIIHFLLTVLL